MPVAVATEEVAMAVAVVTEEVGEFPVALAEAAILVRCLLEAGECSLAAEWPHGVASAGVAAIGTAAIGEASTGVVATGTGATGGVVAGTMVMTLFSSGISVFRGGGAGILGAGATPMDTTDILIIPIHTTTTAPDTGMVTMAMVMGRPAMTTDITPPLGVTTGAITAARTMEMAIRPIQEWPSCNADLRGPGITLGLLMESWGVKPGKQFALSSATMPNP
jgi:hypothetical protein